MTDERDINALRHYVARLEDDLAKAETDLVKAWGYSSKQAVDIVTLGQEVGRLREALRDIVEAWDWWQVDTYDRCQSVPSDAINEARAALAEKEEK